MFGPPTGETLPNEFIDWGSRSNGYSLLELFNQYSIQLNPTVTQPSIVEYVDLSLTIEKEITGTFTGIIINQSGIDLIMSPCSPFYTIRTPDIL